MNVAVVPFMEASQVGPGLRVILINRCLKVRKFIRWEVVFMMYYKMANPIAIYFFNPKA